MGLEFQRLREFTMVERRHGGRSMKLRADILNCKHERELTKQMQESLNSQSPTLFNDMPPPARPPLVSTLLANSAINW